MRNAALVALSLLFLAAAPARKPVTIAELDDRAGDVQPGNTSDGKRAPYDVVHLTLTSDGKNVLVAATLKDAPGSFASNIVRIYFDTDNNAKSGITPSFTNKSGFEYVSEVDACINYADGSSACVGGLGESAKIKSRYGVANVSKYGAEWTQTNQIRSVFQATSFPLEGKTFKAAVAYADLGVKPGSVVRIVVREADGPYDETADFPEVWLQLK